MMTAAIVLLCVFTVIASFDGLWLHLAVYRLHERPECRREHLLHTLNACLFPLTLFPLFLAQSSGGWLWYAVGAHAAVVAVELADVVLEPESRAFQGGLTGFESSLHFLMSGLRWAYVALFFGSVPLDRWTSPTALEWHAPLSSPLHFVTWSIAFVSVPIAVLHVVLARRRPLPAVRALS